LEPSVSPRPGSPDIPRDIVGRRSIIDRGGTASLRALDAATGDEQWREPLAVSASPVVADGR
jgi:outer membrane protein assembly factor BamB